MGFIWFGLVSFGEVLLDTIYLFIIIFLIVFGVGSADIAWLWLQIDIYLGEKKLARFLVNSRFEKKNRWFL